MTTFDVTRLSLEDVFAQIPSTIKTLRNETGRSMTCTWSISEFSSFCPATGYPDYATIEIEFEVAVDGVVPEQKDFRNWLNLFRNVDAYQEEITMAISELFANLGIEHTVTMNWKGRGGISNEIIAQTWNS
jgi:NADPH-dependent 7-cyano-7-deazaguanine reductase QueF